MADGWLGDLPLPEHAADQLAAVRAGREAAGAGLRTTRWPGSTSSRRCPSSSPTTSSAAGRCLAGYTALYIGGMGSREQNFYNALARRMGFEEAAETIQDLYLAGRARDAAAAVPFELIDATALIGPPERIAERIGRYADAGVTTLSVAPHASTPDGRAAVLRVVAEALRGSGVGST